MKEKKRNLFAIFAIITALIIIMCNIKVETHSVVISELTVNDDSIIGKGGMSSSGFHYRDSDYEVKGNTLYIKSYGSYIPSLNRAINHSEVLFKFNGDFKNIEHVYIDNLPLWNRDKNQKVEDGKNEEKHKNN